MHDHLNNVWKQNNNISTHYRQTSQEKYQLQTYSFKYQEESTEELSQHMEV